MTIKEIGETIEQGESLKTIAQAYSEIANLKLQRIRSAVLRNRLFFDEISKIYGYVKALAIEKKIAVPKPKKRLAILITSNNRFYGNINSSLINYFVGSIREIKEIDTIIIGKGAIDYFKISKLLPEYKEVLLKDDMPTSAELMNLSEIISQYNQVQIFHPKLKSLLVQMATFMDITAVSSYLQAHVQAQKAENKEGFTWFIFEPELAKILSFFDTQILTLLLEQTFLESELSRTASRFTTMDSAEIEANKFIKEYQTMKSYAKRNLDNNKILESFASMMTTRKAIYG